MISTVNDFGYWDGSQVGGKAFSLSRLFKKGFNVPKAFCINIFAYQKYVQQNQSLTYLVNQILTENLKEGQESKNLLEDKFKLIKFSDDFESRILNEINKLGCLEKDFFAVRSSATTEDLIEASFAGQYDSFLNVRGREAVLEAVKKCWSSLWTARAISYRERNEISHSDALMAVIVQKMITAKTSGVAFSLNPINGNTNQVLINVVQGKGENLVSGIETPSEYILDKTTKKIISSKFNSIFQPKLTRGQLNQLLNITKKIESHFHSAQDIEWSFTNRQLFILQSRPITTFQKIIRSEKIIGNWTRIGFDDWLRKPMTPLFETLVVPILNSVADDLIAKKINLYRKAPTWTSFDGFFYTKLGFKPTFESILIPFYFLKMVKNIHLEWSGEFVVAHKEKITRLKQQKSKNISEIKKQLNEIIHSNATAWAYIILTGISAKLSEKIFSFLFNLFVPSKYNLNYTDVLSGYFNKSIEADESLWQIAQNAKKDPLLFQSIVIDNNNFKTIKKNNQSWGNELSEWIENYGHRLFELDIFFPSIQDEPDMALNIVRSYLKNNTSISPNEKYITNFNRSENYKHLYLNRIFKNIFYGRLLRKSFMLAEQYVKIRENRPFYLHYGWPLMKRKLIEIAQIAVDKKLLVEVNDIFFLQKKGFESIFCYLETKAVEIDIVLIQETVKKNKLEYELRKTVTTIPLTVSSNLILNRFLKLISFKAKQKNSNTFFGHSGSSGRVKGIICKIKDEGDFHKLDQNQILLALYTTPAWTPLLSIAKGIITQHGGALSHAAIIAREYQIPAVLGVNNIFDILNDGDEVELDGQGGFLTLIKKNQLHE